MCVLVNISYNLILNIHHISNCDAIFHGFHHWIYLYLYEMAEVMMHFPSEEERMDLEGTYLPIGYTEGDIYVPYDYEGEAQREREAHYAQLARFNDPNPNVGQRRIRHVNTGRPVSYIPNHEFRKAMLYHWK
jgi:hypothetical protein